jgi:hypothetical protein
MREPKRLAHRQAERNKARALKHWVWHDEEDPGGSLLAVDDRLVELDVVTEIEFGVRLLRE